MVRWARRTIELCDKLYDRTGFLQVADHLQHGLGLLGENDERLNTVRRWAAEAVRAEDTRSLIDALQASARVRQRMGDGMGATADLNRALMVARPLNDRDLLIDVLNTANAVHGEGGRDQLALDAADEALRWATEGGDPTRLFSIHFSRGFALNQLNRPTEAHEAFQQALKVCRQSGEVWQQAIVLGNIGVALWSMGHPEEGHNSLLRALELKRQVGDQKEIGLGLLNVGYSFYRLGDLQRARSYTEEARREFARRGFVRGELIALGNLGEILWLSGTFAEALQYYGQAEALLRKYPHKGLQIELLLRKGELALTEALWSEAELYFQNALELAEAAGAAGFECNAYEGLAECHREADPMAVAFPQRVWWRAARIAGEQGRSQDAATYGARAADLLKHERSLLTSFAARNRLVRAFPWNLEIIARRRARRSA
jgi:tetratricopeptide (TPR) repeat protein